MPQVLTVAQTEIFRRPPEEQHTSWASLRDVASSQRRRCREIETRDRRILFSESGEVHFGDESVLPTHFSLGQLAAQAKVPLGVLQRLRPETRASVLNQCYERTGRIKSGLTEGDGLRCVTGPSYCRVYDDEVLEAIDRWVIPAGFVPAVPTMGDSGSDLKPALFRSDRDSFFFLFSTEDPHDAFGGLRKGICIHNSEVGARSLGWMSFVFREVCQNFMIWGASGVVEASAKHMGRVREVLASFEHELRTISNSITPLEYSVIERAAKTPFVESGKVEDAARRLNREFKVPKDLVPQVLEAISLPENPGELTAWGVANGLTSVAKLEAFAADRTELAAVAGEVLRTR